MITLQNQVNQLQIELIKAKTAYSTLEYVAVIVLYPRYLLDVALKGEHFMNSLAM
jgi:hypothetical protein